MLQRPNQRVFTWGWVQIASVKSDNEWDSQGAAQRGHKSTEGTELRVDQLHPGGVKHFTKGQKLPDEGDGSYGFTQHEFIHLMP